MYYLVTAKLREESAGELYRKLEDGTIARQQPDGQELVDSMHRARRVEGGRVRWTEMCFCSPPLAHERRTVLDLHFEDLELEPIPAHRPVEGEPFLDWLAERFGGTAGE